jgi:hypothetical protein
MPPFDRTNFAPLDSLESGRTKRSGLSYPADINSLSNIMMFHINVAESSPNYQTVPGQSRSNQIRDAQGGVRSLNTGTVNSGIGELRAAPVVGSAVPDGAEQKLGSIGNATFGLKRKTKRIETTISLYASEMLLFDENQQWETPNMTDKALSALGNLGAFGRGAASVANAAKSLVPLAGYAVNPVIEVLYGHPTLRSFQFDFSFAPKNPAEAKQVIEIIKTFRKHAAPEVAPNLEGMFFIAPSEFDIEFYTKKASGGSGFVENEYIPRISTCVLKTINTNYAPHNLYTTFHDGVPVNITLRLAFQEVDIITRELIEAGF